MKIFIADDHAIVRDGLKRILSEHSGMEVCGEAENGRDALRALKQLDWDILLLDVSMPGMGGLETLKHVAGRFPGKPVLILTQHEETHLARRFLKAGASGYLTKQEASAELIKAIRRISQSRRYVAPSVAEEMFGELETEQPPATHTTLSDREYNVLCRIASGKSLSAIAEELTISVSTVSTYRRRILDKMNLSSNAELTRYALDNDLLE
nr:response regulator transcription factor [Magnetococcales bacterium]